MKKIIPFIMLVAIIISSKAQENKIRTDSIKSKVSSKEVVDAVSKGLYIGMEGGYGFSAAKTTYENSTYIYGTNSGENITVISYSLGKGINAGLYAGYMFNRHFGAELGASYFMGQKFNMSGETGDSKDYGSLQGNMIRIIPAVKYVFGKHKLHTYMKVGLIIGVGVKVIQDDNYTFGGFTNSITTWEYKSGISYGFHGALGINYMFTDRIGAFAELAGYYQNWAPKKAEMTQCISNGVDILPTINTYSKEREYVSSYSTNNPDYTQPQKLAKFYYPFSSIGFNIELHIMLGKKKE